MLKLIGASLVVISCGGFGLLISLTHKREVSTLDALLRILEWMTNDLRMRLTPLPDLCRIASGFCEGDLCRFFLELEKELDKHASPDASTCAGNVLKNKQYLSSGIKEVLTALGESLGRFDAEGQVKSLESVKCLAADRKAFLCKNMDARLRSYQTLGLCAGAALAILLV